MGFFDVLIKAECENVQSLKINPDFDWVFSIQCSHCHETHPNNINFSSTDEVEMTKSHGTCNFLMNCKNCSKSMTINTYDKSAFIVDVSNQEEGTLATFECRGCEIIEWTPLEGIILVGEDSGTCFEDVDIRDVWMEYDEKTGAMCQLLEAVEFRIERNKKIK